MEKYRNTVLEEIMQAAKNEIERRGWAITETYASDGTMHLICEKNGTRHAWGLFDPFICYSEAYKAINGKEIESLKRKTGNSPFFCR